MAVQVNFPNLTAILRQMAAFGADIERSLGRALYEEVTEVAAEAKERYVPVEYGTLRDSIQVSQPVITGHAVAVTLGAGGPAADYAVAVHEDMRPKNWRKPGTGPKYLEKPIQARYGHSGFSSGSVRNRSGFVKKLNQALERQLKEIRG